MVSPQTEERRSPDKESFQLMESNQQWLDTLDVSIHDPLSKMNEEIQSLIGQLTIAGKFWNNFPWRTRV